MRHRRTAGGGHQACPRHPLAWKRFRFVEPYLNQPKFAQVACETVVELAHHKELRQPNKAEFNKALDKVVLLSKDPEVILRAKHYLKDETWVEKQIKGK